MRRCLILAAGAGRRLVGRSVAKPLFPVLGVPMIERVIMTARRAGLRDFTVVTGCEGEKVRRFLDGLAVRRGLSIHHVVNEDWRVGNGLSLLKAEHEIQEPFVLLMADHLVEARLLTALQSEQLGEVAVRLGVDFDTRNPRVDLEDVTKVQVEGTGVRRIGKEIESYDGFDTGCFACTRAIFSAIERARAEHGDSSLSRAIQVLADDGKVEALDVGDSFWVDVDDRRALQRAERALLDRLEKSTDGPVSRHVNRPLSRRLSRRLVWSPVTPNQISLFCLALAALAGGLFALGGYLALAVGAVLALLASVLDGCDGEVARLRFVESSFGGWFDAVLDRYADAMLLLGLTWHSFAQRGTEIVLLVGFLAIIGSFMNSYTADKYDGLMKERFEQGRGFRLGRDVRVFTIGLGALLNLPFLTLALIAGVANLETVRRILVARRAEGGARG